MKHLNKLLFILFIVPLFSIAQSNYKPGYVINLKGDTLRGYIDYREWDSNPLFINFKSTITEKVPRRFTPQDIGYFNIDRLETYQTYIGNISMDSTDPNHVTEERDTSGVSGVFFFKVLQKGKRITLYAYSDKIKTRYFIKQAADAAPIELVYRTYINLAKSNPVSGSGKTVNEDVYLKQLLGLAQKYNVLSDAFQWDIDHSSYNKADILRMVSKINEISKSDYTEHYNGKARLNFFIGAAVNISTTKPSDPFLASGARSYTSTLPEASLGLNFFANPNTGKLVFRIELMGGESQYKTNYTNTISPYIPLTYSFNQFAFSISPQIIYNFYNAENFKIYADVGIAYTFLKYSNEIFTSQDGKTPTSQISENQPFFFNKTGTPVMFKAGVQFSKNWGIYADYLNQSLLTEDPFFVLNMSTVQIGVNYNF